MSRGSRGEERKRQSNGQAHPKGARGEDGAGADAPRLSETDVGARNVVLGGFASGSSSGMQAGANSRPTLVQRSGDEMRTNDVVIGFGVTSYGKLRTRGAVFIDGVVEGADLESATLSIGRDGAVYGSATIGRADIAGIFTGDLYASDEVVLRSSATVSGSVTAPSIVVHRGASVSAATTTVERRSEDPKRPDQQFMGYMPPRSSRRRRIRLGPMAFSMALVAALVSIGAALALLGGG